MKALIPFLLLIGLNAHAYSPEGTSVTGTTSTATGNDSSNDDGGHLASDPPAATTTPSYLSTDTGSTNSCPVVTLGKIEDFLKSNPTKSQVDAFNKKAIKAGESGFLVQYSEQGDQDTLEDMMALDKLDTYDATSPSGLFEVTYHEPPTGVDVSGSTPITQYGIANSVFVKGEAEVLNSAYPSTEVDSYSGLTVHTNTEKNVILVVNETVQNAADLEDTIVHEAFHAATFNLFEILSGESIEEGGFDDSAEGKAKQAALDALNSVFAEDKKTADISDAVDVTFSDDYYNHPWEYLAACAQENYVCNTYPNELIRQMRQEGMSDSAIQSALHDMETDPARKQIMNALNGVVKYMDKD